MERSIDSVDIEFSRKPRRMVVLRDCPRIETAGITIGPLKSGEVFEIEYSIGKILERRGVARFDEEFLTSDVVFKTHWRENVQTPERLSKLPQHFYPMLRRLLVELRRRSKEDSDRFLQYKQLVDFSKDIVDCRLRKLVRLTTVTVPKKVLENLTPEEKGLYDNVSPMIKDWKERILGVSK